MAFTINQKLIAFTSSHFSLQQLLSPIALIELKRLKGISKNSDFLFASSMILTPTVFSRFAQQATQNAPGVFVEYRTNDVIAEKVHF